MNYIGPLIFLVVGETMLITCLYLAYQDTLRDNWRNRTFLIIWSTCMCSILVPLLIIGFYGGLREW